MTTSKISLASDPGQPEPGFTDRRRRVILAAFAIPWIVVVLAVFVKALA